MLESKRKWVLKEQSKGDISTLVEEMQIEPMTARLLVSRGITTKEAAEAFLHRETKINDPYSFSDMEKSVSRIKEAIDKKEKILIYGDYDADGVTSTAVIYTAIRDLGGNVDFFLPNRFIEGYGLHKHIIKEKHEAGFTLIITVDTGVSGAEEVAFANELGMDVIVTDHHEAPDIIPEAYGIIHPKLATCNYPFHELAGVGVAFQLAHGLLGELPKHLLDFVVIGTIADLVPLQEENRTLVKWGLKALRQTNRPGLKALLEVAEIEQGTVTEQEVGFGIAPRMNAVGRLGDATPALQLLLTGDTDEAKEIAQYMQEVNKERQAIVQVITEEAIQEIDENPIHQGKVLVVAKEGWNPGVIGIVASRLVEKYYRPVIVLGIEESKAKGSARSIAGFDLFANLNECKDILSHFGGHPMAAGMTLASEDVETLRNRLNKLAEEKLVAEDLVPKTEVDLHCDIQDISLKALEELEMLAPFGMGNPKPTLVIENIQATDVRQIGGNGNHLKMTFTQGGDLLDSVGFGLGYVANHLSQEAKISVLGEASINEWNNKRKPQFILRDIKVLDWQLFDVRGNRDVKKQIGFLGEDVTIVTFQKEKVLDGYETVFFQDVKSLGDKNVVFLGLPSHLDEMMTLFQGGFPRRIYAGFSTESSEMFQTASTREHFKTYYGLIHKYGPFPYREYSGKISKWQGWSQSAIDFMTKVFFELDFVIIENGLIRIMKSDKKRDFAESPTYRKKQDQLEVEQVLLYSSYQQLKQWLDQFS